MLGWLLSWRGLSTILIVAGVFIFIASFGQLLLAEAWFWVSQQRGTVYTVDDSLEHQGQRGRTEILQPVSTGFGLVIEKLKVNEAVAAEVDPYDPGIYLPILQRSGVAHAQGGAYPGQHGMVYLFGHSTVNIWDIGRNRAPFTLLNKLSAGDRIVTYYQGQRFDYEVQELKVVMPTEVNYLSEVPAEPTLILQTCDPPGSNVKRLLVVATLM